MTAMQGVATTVALMESGVATCLVISLVVILAALAAFCWAEGKRVAVYLLLVPILSGVFGAYVTSAYMARLLS